MTLNEIRKHVRYGELWFAEEADPADNGGTADPDAEPAAEQEPETKPKKEKKSGEATHTDAWVNRKLAEQRRSLEAKHKKELEDVMARASMDAQQLAEHERDSYKAELDELKRTIARQNNETTVRSMADKEDIPLSADTIALIVRDDEEETEAIAKAVISDFKRYKRDLMGGKYAHKAPAAGTTASGLKVISPKQLADLRAIKDPVKRSKERARLKEEGYTFGNT